MPPLLLLQAELLIRRAPADLVPAVSRYEEARAAATLLGMRSVAAHCHLGLGKLYRRAGRRQEAQEHLATAMTMYLEMDMRIWLETAQAEMKGLA